MPQAREIESVHKQLRNIEEAKKQKLLNREHQVTARLKQREVELEAERERQRKTEREKQEARTKVYKNMVHGQRNKQKSILQKSNQKSAKAQEMQRQKQSELKERLIDGKLRQESIQAALERKQRRDEYRRQLIQEKIDSDTQRTLVIKKEKEALLRRRQDARISAERQRKAIIDSFDQMKVRCTT